MTATLPDRPAIVHDRVATLAAATAVVRGNWGGAYTVPATGLYPHQWSWDSAFIAIGLRHLSPRRAQLELDSLLSSQWADGRLPQIVYDARRDDDYAPSAAFWGSADLPGSPPVPTTGLIQPPVHAWAVWLVHAHEPAESARRGFLERAYPRLVAWHRYLRERRAAQDGLAAVVHPWESGTDNSPLWDDALARVPGTPRAPIERPDLQHADASERPSNKEYGKYFWLAERYRDHGCSDADPDHPFVVNDPTTNALWARAELALADIAEALGRDGAAHRAEAARIVAAMEALWDADLEVYVALDRRTGELVRKATVGGLMALLLPADVLPPGRADALLRTAQGPRFLDVDGAAPQFMAPSYDATAPDLDPALYWRGPAWFNMMWLLLEGLRTHGLDARAEKYVDPMVEAAVREGFPEYVNPWTGDGHGTRSFSWTAALTVDLLSRTVFPEAPAGPEENERA
ncbi:MGH1-like glycoside hydrolase domain-containing protein [Nocardioides albus]|uniref:Mannosylglycerate hydrolase MGH1-like glycoside hydrolase domain-containing protein n=1 Tax=Nocardioides albus TaxID=1841 RepID=A0A7W5F791_9ACTN|nr:hypothetical protein [Nocardioides albus]MBB3087925.1 hypothetical protein [Nocardioides albus]GGU21347.1 hypothetical protein GCM10007979_19920 [Nocardioides albus]